MVGYQNSKPFLLKLFDNLLHVVHRDRVHPGKRFVQQNEHRVGHQRPGDLKPAALASGKRHGLLLCQMGKLQFGQQLFQPLLAFAPADRQRFQDGHYIVLHRKLPEYRRLLRQIPHAKPCPLVHRHVCDIQPAENQRSGIRLDKPHYHVETGGLAGTVGAQQPNHFARPHIYSGIVHHRAPVVRFFEPFGLAEYVFGFRHL
ncbi:hypothetical protein SDC9_136164 [bioreactor metagenome]|uniref:Uncharacterized protein n=1 Tax=bioreactor metagenome TaxID=1076179 RepID=A0A645DIB7_9ZZZZ